MLQCRSAEGLGSHTNLSSLVLQGPSQGSPFMSLVFSWVLFQSAPITDAAWWYTGFGQGNQGAPSTRNSQETSSGLQNPTLALFLALLPSPTLPAPHPSS